MELLDGYNSWSVSVTKFRAVVSLSDTITIRVHVNHFVSIYLILTVTSVREPSECHFWKFHFLLIRHQTFMFPIQTPFLIWAISSFEVLNTEVNASLSAVAIPDISQWEPILLPSKLSTIEVPVVTFPSKSKRSVIISYFSFHSSKSNASYRNSSISHLHLCTTHSPVSSRQRALPWIL
jgi:hypothetical protein